MGEWGYVEGLQGVGAVGDVLVGFWRHCCGFWGEGNILEALDEGNFIIKRREAANCLLILGTR